MHKIKVKTETEKLIEYRDPIKEMEDMTPKPIKYNELFRTKKGKNSKKK